MISENLSRLREEIETVCKVCGRDPEDIDVVAVSKTFTPPDILAAYAEGVRDFGENYVQELQAKKAELSEFPIRWHFIGHLQSNKAKYIAPYISLIQVVDSLSLARELDKQAAKQNRIVDILIEVHTTREETKFGVYPDLVVSLASEIASLAHVNIKGLMTMGPFADDPNESRPSFRILRKLKEELESLKNPSIQMEILSMGMTHDFKVAIEEGATMLRIGTAIFGTRI